MDHVSKLSFPFLPSAGRKAHKDDTAHDTKPAMDLNTGANKLAQSKTDPFLESRDLHSEPPWTLNPAVLLQSLSNSPMQPPSAERRSGQQWDYSHTSSPVVEVPVVPHQQNLQHQASSNVLGGVENIDSAEDAVSISSSMSQRMNRQVSSSTLRSYYDVKRTPLAISQQTSASAVRDMALRKGHIPITTRVQGRSTPSMDSLHGRCEGRSRLPMDNSQKTRPARLDLSKLFPKPTAPAPNLLSPTKFVSSPSAMSGISEYFPCCTPSIVTVDNYSRPSTARRSNKLTKPRRDAPALPVRPDLRKANAQLEIFESIKVHVRRPRRGIQHWWDGLAESSEEEPDDVVELVSGDPSISEVATPVSEMPHENFTQPCIAEDGSSIIDQESVSSQNRTSRNSQVTTSTNRTRRRGLSGSNLQDESVLALSSSDDEDTDNALSPVRESVAVSALLDENVLIGRAQALEVRPSPANRAAGRSNPQPGSRLSADAHSSTTTSNPNSMHSSNAHHHTATQTNYSRRSVYNKQPSVVPEGDGIVDTYGPKLVTIRSSSLSRAPSTQGIRSALGGPKSQPGYQKLMVVTEEEEALLEMMRRKRAAMAKQSFTEGYQMALKLEKKQRSSSKEPGTTAHTSVFLETSTESEIMDAFPPTPTSTSFHSRHLSQSTEAASTAHTSLSATHTVPSTAPTALTVPSSGPSLLNRKNEPPTSLSISMNQRTTASSQAAEPPQLSHISPTDSSTTPRPESPDLSPYHLPRPKASSPLLSLFPSPLPSPTTVPSQEGPLTPERRPSVDVSVNVAGSTPGSDFDADTDALNYVAVPAPPKDEHTNTLLLSSEVAAFPMPASELAPRSSKREEGRKSAAAGGVKTVVNTEPRTTGLEHGVRRASRVVSAPRSARCSVSEDVLAAWGALGGWRDFGHVRVAGL